ncbi:MAG: HAMP domain-containing histidine kinase [Clostridia bacterium]|nr:HAMP domain-containing histidine kinase [Clostridia bacterium]
MKNLSIKVRLSIWYAAAMLILGIIITILMIVSSKTLIEGDTRRMLASHVSDNSARIDVNHGDLYFRPSFRYFDEGVHISVYTEDGKLLYGELPPDFDASAEQVFHNNVISEVSRAGQNYYVYDRLIWVGNTYRVWVRGIISKSNASMIAGSSLLANVLMISLLIIFASCGGYFISKRLLSPVEKITETARKICDSNDLSERIGLERGDDEIHRLASTFDDMLEKLQKNFEAEKQFTSDASHELRTPVAVIISECEYMLNCPCSEHEYKEAAGDIKEQAERMSKLISELLAMSRMDRGVFRLSSEETDVSELLSFICDDQSEVSKRGIRLEKNIEPEIIIFTDRVMLTRVFANLIGNAFKYGRDNGSVSVSLEKKDGNIVFSVTDDGEGIAPEHIDRIWDRFYQIDTARQRDESGSTGLGLSMVKEIAKLFNAGLNVVSSPGCGSTFTFTMPIDTIPDESP